MEIGLGVSVNAGGVNSQCLQCYTHLLASGKPATMVPIPSVGGVAMLAERKRDPSSWIIREDSPENRFCNHQPPDIRHAGRVDLT
jgi:hypothetical protein